MACHDGLPVEIRAQADKAFDLLKQDSRYPSLQLKKVGHYWSARVGLHYRALALEADEEDTLIWFWIGNHNEYDKMIR